MELCIECRERPIDIKKRKLCNRCFSRLRVRGVLSDLNSLDNTPVYHIAEMDFVKNYFKHSNWTYQAVTFRLDNTTYKPDFYDGDANVFIEVVGTKQAFSANKQKYTDMRKLYPKIKFEIRLSNGELFREGVSFERQQEDKITADMATIMMKL